MSTPTRVELAMRDAAQDVEGRAACAALREEGLPVADVRAVRVYTLAGRLADDDAHRAARELLADPVIEDFAVNAPVLQPGDHVHAVEIARRPGVMEPAEQSVMRGLSRLGLKADHVRLARRFWVTPEQGAAIDPAALERAVFARLANATVEEAAVDAPIADGLADVNAAAPDGPRRREVPLAGLDDDALVRLSKDGQLHLNAVEMRTVQAHFAGLGRAPTDIELETIAQTWSEHCSHKTFRGRIRYRDEDTGVEETIDNLLKTTVAAATRELDRDWCWSVFEDNAGVIDFDGETGLAFKVETHNHPSAIEPYGGAGTGIGGCIRDPMGTGLGGKPILNTDVFCFGPPDTPASQVPPGALAPARIMRGVVAGVRDYGNRMGIPTANGAVCFDPRFMGNPLVFCGCLARIPKDMAKKRRAAPGQLGVVVGGRTGRDGIHGATFSSVELAEDSQTISAGAVQIGNPIEEKKVLDFLLRARDAGLYTALTDCGAGGLSSALGEMGEDIGVAVDLEKIPLKYAGLSPTEAWISEAQERMVLAVDPAQWDALKALADEEDVEITAIARFTGDHRLTLNHRGETLGDVSMEFLHGGVPRTERAAVWKSPAAPRAPAENLDDYTGVLHRLLSSWNICSKEWIIRQYDHEVQALSVLKPLVGRDEDGPGDAAVVTPVLGSPRACAVSNGLNTRYADLDPYWMAAAAIDEALRNIVAVGGSLDRCAILDNFCWGNTDYPDRLGGLVRAARACYDFAVAYGTPFISGKDSLNNEYSVGGASRPIPGTLLVSALAVMPDARLSVSMDLKAEGNALYMVGLTADELGGSEYLALRGFLGDRVPRADAARGRAVFGGLSQASAAGLVRAMHDCSEGGLAVAAAEMAFAGGFGLHLDLDRLPVDDAAVLSGDAAVPLFSESTTRLLAEVSPGHAEAFEKTLAAAGAPFAKIGAVVPESEGLRIALHGRTVVHADLADLKASWQRPFANE